LAGVHALVSDKGFGAVFVAVGVAEDDFGKRGSTAGIMDDFLDDAPKVAMSLSILHTHTGLGHKALAVKACGAGRGYIKDSEFGSALPQTGVGLEDAPGLSARELVMTAGRGRGSATSVRG
jgi:hypothetical protein